MGYCALPIITQNYDSIDWYGIEPYLNFVSTKDEAYKLIIDMKRDVTPYLEKSIEIQNFMSAMHTEFFEKLDNLMET